MGLSVIKIYAQPCPILPQFNEKAPPYMEGAWFNCALILLYFRQTASVVAKRIEEQEGNKRKQHCKAA